MENNTNSTTTNAKRAGRTSYNPTIAVMFNNEKFGAGALLSSPLREEEFTAIQNHIQIGTRLLLKKAKSLARNGSETFFLEVLPPLEEANANLKQKAARKQAKAQNDSDDI